MKSSRVLNLAGMTFNLLTVIERAGTRISASGGKTSLWRCRCACGAEVTVDGSSIKQGKKYSCGCQKRDNGIAQRSFKHGLSRTPLYAVWKAMRRRCQRPSAISYPNYGARGISVCARWESFENFLEDMGEPPAGATLERLNNDLGYGPDNCIWASYAVQARNRRSSRNISFMGETRCLKDWARLLGIDQSSLSKRIKRWGVEKALSNKKANENGIC